MLFFFIKVHLLITALKTSAEMYGVTEPKYRVSPKTNSKYRDTHAYDTHLWLSFLGCTHCLSSMLCVYVLWLVIRIIVSNYQCHSVSETISVLNCIFLIKYNFSHYKLCHQHDNLNENLNWKMNINFRMSQYGVCHFLARMRQWKQKTVTISQTALISQHFLHFWKL